jgi:glycosyltransferase involved in cell wall biosynthesis
LHGPKATHIIESMRIALDARYRTRSGGVSYIFNIVPALLAENSKHDFVLLRFAEQELPFPKEWPTLIVPKGSPAHQAIWDQVVLPRFLTKARIDLYHPLKLMGTAFPSCPQVTVAHAIAQPFEGIFPQSFSERFYWRFLGNRIFRNSAKIIAVSQFIRQFLIEGVGIPEERIHVVHHGLDPTFRRLEPIGAVDARGEAPYLLTVGNIFPVKNHLLAIDVFANLAAEFPSLRLKMAGSTTHAHFTVVSKAVAERGLQDRVDFLGFVRAPQLAEVMNRAALLLMPSLTEGFPITMIESMACGMPIIASARGGIPEAGGDAIRLIDDPKDRAAWTAATRELLNAPALRETLSKAAMARAAGFSWQTAARKTLLVYDSL